MTIGETRDYKPRHDSQYKPRTAFSGRNCNMAAAADAARYYSLGLKDHNHQWYRNRAQNPNGTPDRSGGTNIEQAAEVLEDAGVPSNHWTLMDGRDFGDVYEVLETRGVVISHGDYGAVPVQYRGPIDRTFTDLHSVFAGDLRTNARGQRVVTIGDGLSDDWTDWPVEVFRAYMAAFPGDFTYLVVRPRLLGPRFDRASVRLSPSRELTRFATLTPGDRVHVGGIVQGEKVRGTRNWYRVWVENRIGYVHVTRGEVVVPR